MDQNLISSQHGESIKGDVEIHMAVLKFNLCLYPASTGFQKREILEIFVKRSYLRVDNPTRAPKELDDEEKDDLGLVEESLAGLRPVHDP